MENSLSIEYNLECRKRVLMCEDVNIASRKYVLLPRNTKTNQSNYNEIVRFGN